MSTPAKPSEPATSDARALKGKTGLTRLRNACRYSWQGFRAAYASEEAFRHELWAAVVLVVLAFFLPVSGAARAVMIAAVLLVPIVELLNSAIEAVVDRVSFEPHPLAGVAKDVGSAAVALAIINAAIVWAVCWLT